MAGKGGRVPLEGTAMDVPPVFVSTGCIPGLPEDAVAFLSGEGLKRIELSGGMWSEEGTHQLARQYPSVSFQLHNYFPPPRQSFVFNLSDPSEEGRSRSLEFAKRAIELSHSFGAKVYSLHAGFCGSPPVDGLGHDWPQITRAASNEATAAFCAAIEELYNYASPFGVALMIENNVLTRRTAEVNGNDVLLMSDPDSIVSVMTQVPPSVRLLLDVGHLNVSAHTLGFDAREAAIDLQPFTGGYHLSDNDGEKDLNMPVAARSWYWDYLNREVQFVTLEVSPRYGASFAEQVRMTERMLSGHD